LASRSLFDEVCFHVHFDRPIYTAVGDGVASSSGGNVGANVNGVLLEGSPWSIIIELREVSWRLPPSNTNPSTGVVEPTFCTRLPQVLGSWSVLMGQPDVPGLLYGKPFLQCSPDEVTAELWAQIMANQSFRQAIRDRNGFDLDSRYIVCWSPPWSSWKWDVSTRTWSTTEPKFSNNAGTLELRPSSSITPIPNLLLATAYTREALDTFSMEGATISGLVVANQIAKAALQTSTSTSTIPQPSYPPRPLWFAPLRSVDALMYPLGIPNIGPWLLLSVLLLLLLLLVAVCVSWLGGWTKSPSQQQSTGLLDHSS